MWKTIFRPNKCAIICREAEMDGQIHIEYVFDFNTRPARSFLLRLDKRDLRLLGERPADPPLWTLLNMNRCSNCPLRETDHVHCPVALNLSGVVEEFKEFVSHESVRVTVKTEERTYSKDTTVQQGLSPLLGIVMTTSGCPIMERLKPMVRFHLPFATISETIFRMISMYLVAQYLRQMNGLPAHWDLDGLSRIYSDVSIVNRDFAGRLRVAAKKDANVNALVNLDCFASMVPLAADNTLEEIKPYFSTYLKQESSILR